MFLGSCEVPQILLEDVFLCISFQRFYKYQSQPCTGTTIPRNDTVSVTISLVPGYLTSRLPPKMERSKPRMLRPDMARFYFCFDFGLNIDRRLEFGQSSTFLLILESAPSDHGFMDRNDGQEDS